MDDETKDVTKVEKVQEEQQDDEVNDSDDYSIYNNIKENGAIFVGCGSAAITIVATSLKLASYLHNLAYLRYWGVDSALVSEPEYYLLENVGLSLLFIVSVVVYMVWITKILGEKKPLHKKIKGQKKQIKRLRRTEKKTHKMITHQSTELEKERNDHSLDYYSSTKDTLDEHLQEIKATRSELKKTQVKIKLTSLAVWFLFTLKIVFVSVLCDCLWIIALLKDFKTIKTAIVSALISNLIVIILAKLHVSTNEKFDNGESILLGSSKHKLVSNYWLTTLAAAVLVLCSVYVISEYHYGDSVAKNQKEFSVTSFQDTSCAILAFDSDYLIAEEIKISGDSKSAIIYSDSVFIISKETEPVLEKKSFEQPPIVKAKGEDE